MAYQRAYAATLQAMSLDIRMDAYVCHHYGNAELYRRQTVAV